MPPEGGPSTTVSNSSNSNYPNYTKPKPNKTTSTPTSNIRVFVHWHEQTIFAGEELRCTITFKNVARTPNAAASTTPGPNSNSHTTSSTTSTPSTSLSNTPTLHSAPSFPPNASRSRQHQLQLQRHGNRSGGSGGGIKGGSASGSSLAPPPTGGQRGHHRSSLSLSVPSERSGRRGGSGGVGVGNGGGFLGGWSGNGNGNGNGSVGKGGIGGIGEVDLASGSGSGNGSGSGGHGGGRGHGHKRSVSIVSIGSLSTVDDGSSSSAATAPAKPSRSRGHGHARASSLQILPRAGGLLNGPRSATVRPSGQPSPLFHASFPPDRSISGRRPGTATAPETARPETARPEFPPRRSPVSPNPLAEFRFPMSPSPTTPGTVGGLADEDPSSPTTSGLALRPRDSVPTINEQGVAPSARILSTMSIAGTPRSSGEFYSLSNNSSETLASEYVTQQPLRSQTHHPSPHNRRTSNLVPSAAAARLPETLMMGYAQVQGSFTLDGSLINLGPFEAVKRKAVVGGQGGGVIGLETPKRDSGLLRGFGWGNITSSIGELLGGGELSTIKEMRGIANSKAVPLLSTPQSILFVDLQLGPGESKTYEYSFKLPRGLPPTHRGKAMKISYSLVIGTQRPGSSKEQRVKSVDVPFRVLGSVNSHGEILGHDLMAPYILLRDQATVTAVKTGAGTSHKKTGSIKVTPPSTVASFFSYVDDLLSRPQQNTSTSTSNGALLSPSAPLTPHSPTSSRRPSIVSVSDHHPFLPPPTAKEAIDLAILRSNLTGGSQTNSPNRFEIARNGRRVGVVMLTRPAFRLGETVTCVVDFAGAQVACHAVHAALETAERVDLSLALRSEASVNRVTRKVWASASEAVLFARRWVFTAGIPVAATPEFVTSGVGLEWKVRLEFVVPVQAQSSQGVGLGLSQGQGQNQSQEEEEQDEGEDEEQDEDERDGVTAQTGQSQTGQTHPLLEEISRDDRGGQVLVGVENLLCESFEVAVPLRVYGAACHGLERLDGEGEGAGLVV
ncbi:Rgp1-domain-containing protein [Dichotomopilus funicola]|uniref:Rgp1-domain-containing protein n=1 Tax=Dichotomopilus funicola TaxID=1934379 RepID=A0AAN6V9F7_9PEZI|nr:Rgp1-domain-containing protein [Dichotomopilus funicola]